ncbi:histidine kinase, partial [bacterium]|nr:histidine kinase [bacterium]
TLIADCISRVLFLEEDFDREVALVKERIASINKESILEGFLSLGEISSYGEGLPEFFNKTTVVGVLYE